jgi:hypothetical protein
MVACGRLCHTHCNNHRCVLFVPNTVSSSSFRTRCNRGTLFTYFAWGHNNAYCNMAVLNASPDSVPDLSIAQVQVDGKAVTPNTPALPHTLPKGQQLTIKVTSMFMSGRQYQFSVITSWGNRFTYALQTAP